MYGACPVLAPSDAFRSYPGENCSRLAYGLQRAQLGPTESLEPPAWPRTGRAEVEDARWLHGRRRLTPRGRQWLAELPLPAVSRRVIADSLAMIDAVAPTIEALDREIHARAKADPRVKVVTALPGVGEFTALVLLAEIGDIGRFDNARKLASWAGLTPTVRGSDVTVHHGHICEQGSPYVRWVLGQAAHTAKRHPEFAGGYQAIAAGRGPKIATVAVARKLLTRAYHLLAEPPGETTTVDSTGVAPAPQARSQTGAVTNPGRARSQRHEPATSRARGPD